MAQIILSDCFISIDDVAYSGQSTNVAISMSAEAHAVTPMGESTRMHIGGALEWAVACEFNADESITGQAFFDMVGTVVPIEIRPTSDVRSVTNPSYVGEALLTEYTPLGGEWAAAHTVSLSFVSAGPLTRETTII